MQIINGFLTDIKKSAEKGFLHIVSSQAINRAGRFLSAIVVVRLLTKETYGNFSYAHNILQFFLLFNGLGVYYAILQFCSETDDLRRRHTFLKYGLKIGGFFNLFLFIAIVLFVQFFDLPLKNSDSILLLLSLMPLFVLLFDSMNTYFRASLRNREFSYFNMANTFLYLAGTVVGGYFFQIPGIIGGRYLSFFLVILLGLWFFRAELGDIFRAGKPALKEKREFLKFSLIVAMTNSVSQVLYLIGVFMVGLIIPNESIVASYKTATVIPFALAFVPQSIIMFIYPYFARNLGDKQKLKTYFYKIQSYLVIFNLIVSAGLIAFAPLIIRIAFGAQYLDAVLPFRILSAGYFISGSFRILGGNVLASLRKVQFNLLNSTFTGISNIILNIVLIRRFGSVGAAVATVIVLLLSSIASNVYLYIYFRKKDPVRRAD